ncbi:MAG: division/cell wall cluster transcriptional repressor MraZ [Candidatus Taylorbacteria bacterium RIFCSPLOWO2_02_FULL_43_11]|uniref:Transcriptional regulator MraZ n=1 Tax=Candidatus Taylorbacteria bacterium RIFCSPHIGHO2_02_FULL_43_32b TaxID=1802306 RepID=A0A1G2MKQ4_9BACT|nr:MAG: division/cell wall cluster transcriptional repressor MraZ [Candidatus Taylorbacteria bacterium RIFCSPHIGHO2_01_FULL_43_47]OHA24456.1 MAG: division/cell wall cluster transcriptional repressor MraZ [Candidatus Taylorbacteria bacterium RIFCSPHIGHO2_02_FULL_43_32b]OHA35356.1 MAG: division/cell wall cluster transcriptional repressor MraZ [Candidatus Taylorbacteria bacterium RIFCSPLOWO2_02_FULL_43_11]
MLIGEYIHAIDEKNRLSLPAKFRHELGKKVVVTPGLDGCLFIFAEKEWVRIAEHLSGSEGSMLQSDNRGFNRRMFGGAVEAEIDSIGRILVPDFLKSMAKMTGKVAVVGVKNRLELWDEKIWHEYRGVVERKADQLAERLGQIGIL